MTGKEVKYGEPVYRRCTGCPGAIEIRTLIEGDHDGSVLWTDGFIESSTMPDQTLLARCGACGKVVWLPDLEPVEVSGDDRKTSYEALSVQEHFDLLEDVHSLRADRVIVLRTLAWQKANHARRSATAPDELSEAELKNLQALDAMLGEKWENELLMKIEIAREMKQFVKAQRLMKDVDFSPQVTHLARQLYELIAKRDAIPRAFATKGQG